jgi:hypothetical protein
MKRITEHELYHIKSADELKTRIDVVRFMVLIFKLYNDLNFDLLKASPVEKHDACLRVFDEFMHKSRVVIPFMSELTDQVKTKEMDLIDAVIEVHSTLANLHMGYTSMDLIIDKTLEQSNKLETIRQQAIEKYALMTNLCESMIKSLTKNYDPIKIFFDEQEYEQNYGPTRRERRKKKFGHTS